MPYSSFGPFGTPGPFGPPQKMQMAPTMTAYQSQGTGQMPPSGGGGVSRASGPGQKGPGLLQKALGTGTAADAADGAGGGADLGGGAADFGAIGNGGFGKINGGGVPGGADGGSFDGVTSGLKPSYGPYDSSGLSGVPDDLMPSDWSGMPGSSYDPLSGPMDMANLGDAANLGDFGYLGDAADLGGNALSAWSVPLDMGAADIAAEGLADGAGMAAADAAPEALDALALCFV